VANNLQGLSVDSVFLDVDLTGGKVSIAEAASVYNAIVDSLTIQYENLPSQNLHLIFADVFSKDSVAGGVTFGVISAFGHGSTINFDQFGNDDWWMFGWSQYNEGGYCGESQYHDTHLNEDAATRIGQRIRLHIELPVQRHYATDVVTLEIWPDGTVDDLGDENDNYACDFRVPNDPLDNYCDYYIMYKYSEVSPFNPCLCPNEMNFYYNGTKDVCNNMLYECLGDLITNKVFMSISIYGDNEDSEEYHYYHKLTNTYGIWVLNNDPPSTL
jgi:hypothetical protein